MAHPSTLGTLAPWAALRYGDSPALSFQRDGQWRELSYEDLHHRVRGCAAALRDLGVGRGDRVALMAQTCPEWTVCDLAIAAGGAVCVPAYPTSSAAECAWVIGDSGARLVVYGEDEQRYAPPERVRRYLVLDHDFDVESGVLTPSLKVRRARVHERYRDLIESLYEQSQIQVKETRQGSALVAGRDVMRVCGPERQPPT